MKYKIKRFIKRLFFWISILAMIVGAGYAFVLSNKKEIEYRTEKAEIGNIKQVVTANGQLNPMVVAEVGTQVSGQITKLYVDVNDTVKKDQLIAEIDPKLLEASLKQSKASLEISRIDYEQAARDYERTKQLFAKDYIAKIEVERAHQNLMSRKLSYENSKTQVERDEVNLAYTQIRSPIDGVVIAKEVTEGQTVASSFTAPTLFKIAASLEDMKIDVNVPESDVGQLKEGMDVTFTVDSHPGREFEGKLQSININPNSSNIVVTYSAVVTLKNPERILFPGMTAYVSVTLEERKNVLKVPATAFRFQPPKEEEGSSFKNLFNPTSRYRHWQADDIRNSSPSLYVLRNGQPEEVKVVSGMMDERYVEIVSGDVKAGDEVILSVIDMGE